MSAASFEMITSEVWRNMKILFVARVATKPKAMTPKEVGTSARRYKDVLTLRRLISSLASGSPLEVLLNRMFLQYTKMVQDGDMAMWFKHQELDAQYDHLRDSAGGEAKFSTYICLHTESSLIAVTGNDMMTDANVDILKAGWRLKQDNDRERLAMVGKIGDITMGHAKNHPENPKVTEWKGMVTEMRDVVRQEIQKIVSAERERHARHMLTIRHRTSSCICGRIGVL